MKDLISTHEPKRFRHAEQHCGECGYFGPISTNCDPSHPLCVECETDEAIREDAAGELMQEICGSFGDGAVITEDNVGDYVDRFICDVRKEEGFLHRNCPGCGTGLAKAA